MVELFITQTCVIEGHQLQTAGVSPVSVPFKKS